MIKIVLLFILPFTLFGSKILSYNIYDRTDRVDVMITFDTPYDAQIKKSTTSSKIIIKLQDTDIESTKVKQLSSNFLHALSISPMSGYVKIVASVPQNIILKASKTSDAYGLRLRFTKKPLFTASKSSRLTTTVKSPTFISTLPTKKNDEMSQSYYIVVSILIVGIILLFILKKKVTPNANNKDEKNSWLFKGQKPQETPKKSTSSNSDVTIRFQKNIDEKNSVVMLDFSDQSYLVMMGTNNVLLDRFSDDKPSTQADFESILQERHKVLEDFLEKPEEEPMELYRKKASSISYDV